MEQQQQPVVQVVQVPVQTNPFSGLIQIAGIAVGLAAGYYTHGLLNGLLPEATSTFEKVARGAAIYGGSIAVEQFVSDGVTKSLGEFAAVPQQVVDSYARTKAQISAPQV